VGRRFSGCENSAYYCTRRKRRPVLMIETILSLMAILVVLIATIIYTAIHIKYIMELFHQYIYNPNSNQDITTVSGDLEVEMLSHGLEEDLN
jgi:hypothetical protein